MSKKNLYTGQDAEDETRIFNAGNMKQGYDQYFEDVYSRFFKLTGYTELHKRKKRVLDVGCGSGEFGRRFAKKGYSVTGIDLSKVLVKTANSLAKREKLSLKAVAGNVFNYKGKGFDIVLCAGFLHHFEDLSPIINKLGDFLNKNGEITIIEPNGSNIMIKFTEYARKNIWPFNKMRNLGTLNETNHSVKKYTEEFSKAGFELKSCAGFIAKTKFDDYGLFMNLLLKIKYFCQEIAVIFMEPSSRGTVIVMKFKK